VDCVCAGPGRAIRQAVFDEAADITGAALGYSVPRRRAGLYFGRRPTHCGHLPLRRQRPTLAESGTAAYGRAWVKDGHSLTSAFRHSTSSKSPVREPS
jgi:hypothetical protein